MLRHRHCTSTYSHYPVFQQRKSLPPAKPTSASKYPGIRRNTGFSSKKSSCQGIPSLDWEDPLEKEMATHSSTLAWDIYVQRSLADYSPWDCKRVRHDLVTKQQRKCRNTEPASARLERALDLESGNPDSHEQLGSQGNSSR